MMKRPFTIMRRLLCDGALFLAVFWLPPFFAFLFGAALLFFFPRFYEFFAAAFLLDALYGAPSSFFGEIPLLMTITAFLVFPLAAVLKRRMRFY